MLIESKIQNPKSKILLTIQYLGTRYAGWQTQANATGVQQVISGALASMFGQPVPIEGAGRTDAGVHARAQRAHVNLPFPIAARGLILGLNNLLPHDIRILAAEEVPDTFHCRFDATSKTYEYRVWNGPVADVFAFETHAHVAQPLDAPLMHDTAQVLLGRHDFRAFTVAAPEVSSTERTIREIAVVRESSVVRVNITADGFLRYMVRRIAGTLIEIGRGKLEPAALRRSLAPQFEAARWTAPARGLTLLQISYDG